MSKICIGCIFGTGDLPKLIIDRLKKSDEKFVIVRIGAATQSKQKSTEICAKVGEVGKILDFLSQHGVTDIVLAGKVERPSLNEIKFDKKGLLLLAKLGLKIIEILKGGDDYIISYVIHILKKEGYKIISPEKLAPELLSPRGLLTLKAPSEQDKKDILIGKAVLAALGKFDIGQSIIVENGRVLGIEAAEGTDQLILRCAKLKKQTSGGVLVKMKKRGQETKTDLPAIGVQTILNAHKAGLNGVAFEAGGSLLININKAKAQANASNMFLEGIR